MDRLEPLPTGLKTVITDPGGLTIEIYYLECLAQACYLVHHDKKAFIIDPRRDVDAFVELLSSRDLTLSGVLETHFHADFVSGHCEIGQRTGAPIYFGPSAGRRCKYPIHELHDGEVIPFTSTYDIIATHTPGHTMESVVYLVVDKTQGNKPLKAFTGDTLFIGSCGRPDLVGSIGLSASFMAHLMFRTLKDKIKTLPDDVQVFPAHGAGSPCGKNISKDLFSTIGKERATNVALRYDNKDEFVKFLTSGQPDSPCYFSYNVQLNTEGAQNLVDDLASIPILSASEFMEISKARNCEIIDTRSALEFSKAHLPGSLNFPLGGAGGTIVGGEDGNFAMWVGTCLSNDTGLLLVNSPGKNSETLQRLARIGYTNVKGVLSGGLEGEYVKMNYPITSRTRIDLFSGPPLLEYVSNGYQLLDVRTEREYQANTVHGAINTPLDKLKNLTHLLNKDSNYIAFCLGGFRSTIATSILSKEGFKVQDVTKGFAAISVNSPEMTTKGTVCPGMKAIIDSCCFK